LVLQIQIGLKMKSEKEKIEYRRRVKRLAEELTYKADIYGPIGRIYSFKAPWKVDTDGKLFHGDTEYDPKDLYDGHGRYLELPR
jgi:hypothetical protein